MSHSRKALLLGSVLMLLTGKSFALLVQAEVSSQNGTTQTTIYTVTAETGDALEAFILEYDLSTSNLVADPTLNPSDWDIQADEPFVDPLDPFFSLPGAFTALSLMGPLQADDSVTFTLAYDVMGMADFGIFIPTNANFDVFSTAIIPTVAVSPPTGSIPEPGQLALLAAGIVGFGFSRRQSFHCKTRTRC